MKILLIHPRLARSGGLETRLFNYAQYFISRGHEVHIACRKVKKKDVLPGMIIHKFPPLFVPNKMANFHFNRKLEKWKKPAFDFELSLGRTTIQKNILAPATHKGYLWALSKKIITKDDQMQIDMDQKGYDASEHIFACSTMVKNEVIEKYKIAEHKVHVLYPPFNAASHARFSIEEKNKLRTQYNLDQKKVYHLFISTSHDRKGLPLLMSAFGKLKDTPHTLLIIGNSIQVDQPNVISLGYIKDTRIAYALGDYLLHPAKYEPYGQIINEALHHQIPVVVSKNTGAGEILQPQYGIIAPDFSPDNWVNIIHDLPNRTFNIPPTLLDDLHIGLDAHMKKMLAINGIQIQ